MSEFTFSTGFVSGYAYDGKPYTADASKMLNPIGIPFWFSRGVVHRAIVSLEGPYEDPNGLFKVLENELMVFWEIKQGTPEWTPPADKLIPTIFSIHPINRTFVTPGSLMHKTVDPDHIYAPGDKVAVMFQSTSPPFVAGRWRPIEPGLYNRDDSGSFF